MLLEFSNWLAKTEISSLFSDPTHIATWLIVPVSQTIHILGVAVVMIAAGMLNLHLLGVRVSRQSFAELSVRWMPWIWVAMAALLLTGVAQTIAEPSREIMNLTFRIKVIMLVVVVLITATYRSQVKKDPNYWAARRGLAQSLAAISIVLWFSIVAAGRLIAYVGAIET